MAISATWTRIILVGPVCTWWFHFKEREKTINWHRSQFDVQFVDKCLYSVNLCEIDELLLIIFGTSKPICVIRIQFVKIEKIKWLHCWNWLIRSQCNLFIYTKENRIFITCSICTTIEWNFPYFFFRFLTNIFVISIAAWIDEQCFCWTLLSGTIN